MIWHENFVPVFRSVKKMLGEGGREGGQSRKSKVRSENSQPDFRTSEIDIRFRLFKLKIDFLKRLLSL